MTTNVIQSLDPKNYYRLPWTLTDNVLGWLEPTKRCNLYCEGCYSRNDPTSDKSLAVVRSDLEVMVSRRKMDSISIAGGDPLVHPQIVEIVRMVREEFGLKPIVNTNGFALTRQLLLALKRAGIFGFTFHVDSNQARPGWEGKTEVELNELRMNFARMIADVGGLSLAFNSTVYRHTIQHVPALVDWAREHIDIVHSMVFILFRTSSQDDFDYYANGKPIDVERLVYFGQDKNPEPIGTSELVSVIREQEPEFEPCAYLGGTANPRSFKWLVSGRLGTPGKIYGYVGRRYLELLQTGHHLLFNRYFAYASPWLLRAGRSAAALGATFDPGSRRALRSYVKSALFSPRRWLETLHFQSIVVIQPIDTLADGANDMCDGCPDMTVHQGELVWSCRLEERLQHGCLLQAVPKKRVLAPSARHLPVVPGNDGSPVPVP
ncbi:MAG TPA: radical SAM protein [Polyangiaceae bacterium]